MDALLLAGGFGTRLRPLTYTRPKPLVPVAGRPMVDLVLDRLPPEVDRVVVAVNWLADKLEAHFDAKRDERSYVVVREGEPLGTAGAVLNCADHLESREFFVLNGDIVSDMDLGALLARHREAGAATTLSLKEVAREDVIHYGVARMDEADPRRIVAFVEKPATPEAAPSRLINAGAYVLDHSVLDLIEPGRLVSMEKEIFPLLLPRGLYGLPFDGFWIDVGDPARLLAASRHVGGPMDSIIGHNCTIPADAALHDCVLGDDIILRPGARLDRCVVGDGETVAGDHAGERIWTQPVPSGYPSKQIGNSLV